MRCFIEIGVRCFDRLSMRCFIEIGVRCFDRLGMRTSP